jgi:hypothetical protein
MKVKLKARAL